MKQKPPTKGDYVVWKINANAKKADNYGFICGSKGDLFRMLTISNGSEELNERLEFKGLKLEMKSRNCEAVEHADVPMNLLEWPLDKVVLWHAAKFYIDMGVYNLNSVGAILARAKERGADQQWIKETIINEVRLHQLKRARRRYGGRGGWIPEPRKVLSPDYQRSERMVWQNRGT